MSLQTGENLYRGWGGHLSGIKNCFGTTRENASEKRIKANIPFHSGLYVTLIIQLKTQKERTHTLDGLISGGGGANIWNNSGAPAARRAAKRSPMASGIARGRVRTTKTTTTTVGSRKMAAILQIIG